MLSDAKLSPKSRGIVDIDERIALLSQYEEWRIPIMIEFSEIIPTGEWEEYWELCERVNRELLSCQEVASKILLRIQDELISK